MKKILGLDLGTTSIGWAFIHEANPENKNEQSSIQKIGVRVNPLSTDEQTDFEKGKPITINADRTLKRGARRNLQRYKQRRENLLEILKEHSIIDDNTILAEDSKNSTHDTFEFRAKAAKERIEKEEFARVLLTINKKRGYKSSRKAKDEGDGQAIDGMVIAMKLYEENLTPGQFSFQSLSEGKKSLPDFYRSDLQKEFSKVWEFQKQFYPVILNDDFHTKLEGQGQEGTRKRFLAIHQVYTAELKGKRDEKKLQLYQWRNNAISKQLLIEEVASVLVEINNNINSSSGYLGAISDRSKELYFNKQTVGEYLYQQLLENPHIRTKGQVFYRQDYLDEFEQIWETQSKFYPELNLELKAKIRDEFIFYQRKLKSQKGLISFCEFESEKKEITHEGKKKTKIIGARVIPKSSPLFQEFKIWQNLSNLEIQNKKTKVKTTLDLENKGLLFEELNIKGNLKKAQILKLLVDKPSEYDLNFTTIEGNRTNQALCEAFQKILVLEGHEIDFKTLEVDEINEVLKSMFSSFGIDSSILKFDSLLDGKALEKQASYQLWHLLYSYEGDNSKTGNDKLYEKLESKFGFKREYAQLLVNVSLQDDYGSLSAKAIRKIMPFIRENNFSTACELAGYNHSSSLTKEENEKRDLNDLLTLLPKNSLRNSVVEKILNQMVNVVNTIIADPTMGKPDEIRIELARELKKNAKERELMTTGINKAKADHDKYRTILQDEFGIKNPSRNDLIRYKLYLELAPNGFKTIYTNKYIERSKLFSKEFDIEHIIPKASLFDDSFSNKTLAVRQVNIDKGNTTAYDFIKQKYGEEALATYILKLEKLFKDEVISKAKYKKCLMRAEDIGEGFIERDLRESQYIAKKAREMLLEVCRNVMATSGSITNKLREDWDLINVMQELNIEKYRALGLTQQVEKKDGTFKERIVEWTKRNDHRHHAMDALTVAFTKHSHIQYLNNLNARKNVKDKNHRDIIGIEQNETFVDNSNKRKFSPPMRHFRTEAKQHIESILISFKAKNKIVTRNKNKIKGSNKTQVALTPRGQLHEATIQGKLQQYAVKENVKIGSKFDLETVNKVAKQAYKDALLKRLSEYDNNPAKAFAGKNSPSKSPIICANGKEVPEKVNLSWLIDIYTKRKPITPDLKLEKVVDIGVRKILQKRLNDFGGKPKEAFVNLDENPIWINEAKGIQIKRVTITGGSNAEPLHNKKDNLGKVINGKDSNYLPVDYVSTGNNHHVAIYRDKKGNLQEEVVSFYEAVARVNAGVPIIDKNHKEGWTFLFTMKQNEMFIFPSDGYEPSEIDLVKTSNSTLISPHLFRVQKIGSKDYWFRHHLETQLIDNIELKNTTFRRINSCNPLDGIIKVRINHLGKIVKVGEY
jgi:CRISPR-associated endonuclease Csn1